MISFLAPLSLCFAGTREASSKWNTDFNGRDSHVINEGSPRDAIWPVEQAQCTRTAIRIIVRDCGGIEQIGQRKNATRRPNAGQYRVGQFAGHAGRQWPHYPHPSAIEIHRKDKSMSETPLGMWEFKYDSYALMRPSSSFSS